MHTDGNQSVSRFANDEFCATVLTDGSIGDIYKFYNHRIYYFTASEHGILTDENDAAVPGTPQWPQLDELRRIRTVNVKSGQLDEVRVIDFTFPASNRRNVFNAN